MSNDLRDLFKKELDQIPLRSADTWVPQDRLPRLRASTWRLPLALAAAALVVIVALIGGRELASFRDRTSGAGPGVVAGKAIYLSPSFNGSGWIQIDPVTLHDLTATPLLDIAPTYSNSFDTQVSEDGSTIIIGNYTNGPKWTVYDARTGRSRGALVPEVRIVGPDYLSADGTVAMGRLATAQGAPMNAERAVVSVPDGRMLRRVPAVSICCIQAAPAAPDLSAVYFVTTPREIGLTADSPLGLQPYSLVVQNTLTGALSSPMALPGITGGTILSFGSPTVASAPVTMRPALALSADGRKLAALSFDGQTLDLVDTGTLAVTSLSVHRKTSLFDLLGPQVAAAKTLNDEERHSMVFAPDGQAVLTFTTVTHYDDLNGAIRTTRDIQRIEVASGLVTATSDAPEAIFSFRVTPDGDGVLVVARTHEARNAVYVLRRLDARTLEIMTERRLPQYAELQLLLAPAVPATTSVACGPATALVPHPSSPELTGAPIGPLLIRGYYGDGATTAVVHGFTPGYPTKMLVLRAQDVATDITLVGARCSDGQPLRFWMGPGRDALPFPQGDLPVSEDRMKTAGQPAATLGPLQLPTTGGVVADGGYMLFPSAGAYRIEGFMNGAKVGEAILIVTTDAAPSASPK